ncbi:PD-(D/E)XK nuclease family protein [Streptomyces violaceorubidus]
MGDGAYAGDWPPPAGLKGSGALVRVQASLAGAEQYTCLHRAESKARPAAWPPMRPKHPKGRLEDFVLGLVVVAVRLVECDGVASDEALRRVLDRAERPLHRAQQRYVRHALGSWLQRDRPTGAPPVIPQPLPWVAAKEQDGRQWELTAWGLQHHNPGRRLREFSFLSFGSVRDRDVKAARVAIAAYAAAFGEPAEQGEKPGHPYRLCGAEQVDQVRVALTGLHDGSYRLLFEGTPEQARAYYEEHGKGRVAELTRGGPATPGKTCTDCRRLTTCEAPRRLPGLLGIPSARTPRPLRHVSASDLRYYNRCPAQYLAYSQNLPRTGEYSPENLLGKAVHAHLETNHGGVIAPCAAHDMPWADTEWGDEPHRMKGEFARTGSRMLAQHLDLCPFNNENVTDVQIEPRLAFYDTAANVIVLAKPDMLYQDNGSPVWREIKTTQSDDTFRGDPFTYDPQLALAVVLLAEGALDGGPKGARVELEVLRPDSGDPLVFEPYHEPERVAKARRLLYSYAEPWRSDEVFTPKPGRHCRICPVSEWCGSALKEANGER